MLQLIKSFFVGCLMLVCVGLFSCLKPTQFTANIPKEPEQPKGTTSNNTNDKNNVVIQLTKDGDILFNKTEKVATTKNLEPLAEYLKRFWNEKDKISVMSEDKKPKSSRAVFLVYYKSLPYSEVTKVIDALKQAGADPVALLPEAVE